MISSSCDHGTFAALLRAIARHDHDAGLRLLVAAGADANSVDRSGAAPLHRAVRSRCAEAVRVLIELGSDPRESNWSGSTPLALAKRTTGRGASGSPEAKAKPREILKLLRSYGAD